MIRNNFVTNFFFFFLSTKCENEHKMLYKVNRYYLNVRTLIESIVKTEKDKK